MKRIYFSLFYLLIAVIAFPILAKDGNKQKYAVAFYNVENLFDTYHDKGKNDHEYLPGGRKDWDYHKYKSKLTNLDQVLGELGRAEVPEGPIAIGLAEVENFRTLQDLISQPNLRKDNFQYVHFEGPDKRGIDCALIYNPELFLPLQSKLVPSIPFQGDTVHLTRGFLIVKGLIKGTDETLTIIVNHWPSRGADAPVRMHAATQVKAITDSLYREDSQAKIIIMGDLNDDPMDKSVVTGLGAKKFTNEVKKLGFYNPWWEVLEDKGIGTLMYRGKWNLFDQIIISEPLLKSKGITYSHCEVFKRDYLFQKSGKYKGSPLRTHGGLQWLNGYSDHLPTIIYLNK